MMRELDTVSPVLWPAWCYSGQSESEPSGVASEVHAPRPPPPPAPAGPPAPPGPGPAGAHRKRRGAAMNGRPVKSERLSPGALSAPPPDTASTSSRSGTPSSPPGPLPAPAPASPANSPASGASPRALGPLDSVTHNYSEFMRTLAAKYQYVHPDEFYSAARNGFPVGMERLERLDRLDRFPYKSGAPFAGLVSPLGLAAGATGAAGAVGTAGAGPGALPSALPGPRASPGAKDRDGGGSGSAPSSTASSATSGDAQNKPRSPPCSAAESPHSLLSQLGAPLFGAGLGLGLGLPPAPLVMDMSSTQALVSMVQRSHQNQLETYLKGAARRAGAPDGPLCPLDLSAQAAQGAQGGAGSKKRRADCRDGRDGLYGVDALLGLGLRTKRVGCSPRLPAQPPASPQPVKACSPCPSVPGAAPGATAAPAPPAPCSPSCSPCPDAQAVAHWSVGDVCNFVGSIDLCVEYVQEFREQRIDGAGLPLLTEEHLQRQLRMKLGPALKLRAVLARRLGHCGVCLHCAHCHGQQLQGSQAATTPTPAPATPTPQPADDGPEAGQEELGGGQGAAGGGVH